jgi:hypothetical protein
LKVVLLSNPQAAEVLSSCSSNIASAEHRESRSRLVENIVLIGEAESPEVLSSIGVIKSISRDACNTRMFQQVHGALLSGVSRQ